MLFKISFLPCSSNEYSNGCNGQIFTKDEAIGEALERNAACGTF